MRAPSELGDAALDALVFLHKNGPSPLGTLSDAHRVTAPTMSQIVNRLVAGGYVERLPDPSDGRRVLIAATSEGERLAAADRARRNAWLEAQLATLSPEDRAALARAAVLLSDFADR